MRGPVEIFEETVDALNRVDRSELERLVDPEITFFPMRSAVQGPYFGHAGIEAFVEDNESMFELFRAEFDTLEPLPDGRLLAIGHIRMRGRSGEGEVVVRTAGIAAFRDGRLLSWHDYGNEPAARAQASR